MLFFYFCGFILVCTILILFYFSLLAVPLHIISSRYLTSQIFRLTFLPIAGILMGLHFLLGAYLASNYLRYEESAISYLAHAGNPYHTGMAIVGAISGVLLQVGVRFRTRTEKVFTIFGVLLTLIAALFTAVLILMPE